MKQKGDRKAAEPAKWGWVYWQLDAGKLVQEFGRNAQRTQKVEYVFAALVERQRAPPVARLR